METNHFNSSESVTAKLRQFRDTSIAHATAISDVKSILKAAGRGDLQPYVKNATKLVDAYFPPTDDELGAIQVGDFVYVYSDALYPGYGFDVDEIVVLSINGEEIQGLMRDVLSDDFYDDPVNVSIKYICEIKKTN